MVHRNLGGENIILAEGRRIMVEGFGWAAVEGYGGGLVAVVSNGLFDRPSRSDIVMNLVK